MSAISSARASFFAQTTAQTTAQTSVRAGTTAAGRSTGALPQQVDSFRSLLGQERVRAQASGGMIASSPAGVESISHEAARPSPYLRPGSLLDIRV